MIVQQCLYPLIAYLLGSIPFGLIFSELFGSGGLRSKGSGNIGSTNVLRTQGKLLGALTLICDFSKAIIPCLLLDTNEPISNLLIIIAPTIGHMFPVWLKFSGGKGVATYLGTMAAVNWMVLLSSLGIWLIVFFICRISSVACLLAVTSSWIIYSAVASSNYMLGALGILVIMIFVKHKDNLIRLWKHQEKRI